MRFVRNIESMQLIDTHAHLSSNAYDGQLDRVLQSSRQAGVSAWISVGTSLDDSAAVLKLIDKHDNIFGTVGIHPHDAAKVPAGYLSELRDIAQHEKIIAIGELGLDYHYEFSDRPSQRRVMEEQLTLAAELDMPAVLHCREAFDDCLAILDAWQSPPMDIVFHCFSGNRKQAAAVLDRGGFLSFTGTITFKNALEIQKVAAYTPLERTMLETDCPYLSPEPKRRIKPNEPALLIHTAEKLAQLRKCHVQQIAEITTDTAQKFFGIKIS